jgi:transposase
MDSLPAHIPTAVRAATEVAGAELRFLPPYSSDFNSDEMTVSELKAFLNITAARTVDAL